MTLCSLDLEKRIFALREHDKKNATKVARRILGIRKFNVLRKSQSPKHPSGWRSCMSFTTIDDANSFIERYGGGMVHCIGEVFE